MGGIRSQARGAIGTLAPLLGACINSLRKSQSTDVKNWLRSMSSPPDKPATNAPTGYMSSRSATLAPEAQHRNDC